MMKELSIQSADPSKISLFGNAPSEGQSTAAHSFVTNSSAFSPDYSASGGPSAPSSPPPKSGGIPFADSGKLTSFSHYQNNRATEVAKRKNLHDRLERVRDNGGGLSFNTPQFEEITNTQFAMYLRRMRKNPGVKQNVSAALMSFVYEDEGDRRFAHAAAAAAASLVDSNIVIAVSDVLQSDDESRYTADDESDATERSTSDEEEEKETLDASDLPSTSSHRRSILESRAAEFYRQRKDILSAYSRSNVVKRMIDNRCRELAELKEEVQQEPFVFAEPPTGDDEEASMTCLRCRPLVIRQPNRQIHEMNIDNPESDESPISRHYACDAHEYCEVDDSVHPQLSTTQSIPAEAKMQKYLYRVSHVPVEIEKKRNKAKRLIDAKEDRKPRSFALAAEYAQNKKNYQLERKRDTMQRNKTGDWRVLQDNQHVSGASDGEMAGDYPLKQKMKKGRPPGSGNLNKNNKRRASAFGNEPKRVGRPPNSENSRRSSFHNGGTTNVDFGSSAFDYDTALMEMGLPSLQHVDYQEIAVPQ